MRETNVAPNGATSLIYPLPRFVTIPFFWKSSNALRRRNRHAQFCQGHGHEWTLRTQRSRVHGRYGLTADPQPDFAGVKLRRRAAARRRSRRDTPHERTDSRAAGEGEGARSETERRNCERTGPRCRDRSTDQRASSWDDSGHESFPEPGIARRQRAPRRQIAHDWGYGIQGQRPTRQNEFLPYRDAEPIHDRGSLRARVDLGGGAVYPEGRQHPGYRCRAIASSVQAQ